MLSHQHPLPSSQFPPSLPLLSSYSVPDTLIIAAQQRKADSYSPAFVHSLSLSPHTLSLPTLSLSLSPHTLSLSLSFSDTFTHIMTHPKESITGESSKATLPARLSW